MISDRLYTDEGSALALAHLWENKFELQENLPESIRVTAYVASHASIRWLPDEDGELPVATASGPEDEDFIEKVFGVCNANGVHVPTGDDPSVSGAGGGLAAKLLMELLAKLIEKWLLQI